MKLIMKKNKNKKMTHFIESCITGDLEKIKEETRQWIEPLNRKNIMDIITDPEYFFNFQVSYDTIFYKGMIEACQHGHLHIIEWIHNVYWIIHDLIIDWCIDQKKSGNKMKDSEIIEILPKSFLFRELLDIALKYQHQKIANTIFHYEII